MKNNKKITLCAVTAALSAALMALSLFPYFTYSAPALCGLFMLLPTIEISPRWAALSYAVSAVIALTVAEPKSAFLYLLFFGYYPILKAVIERIGKQATEWLIKLIVFNVAVVLFGFTVVKILGLSLEPLMQYGIWALSVLLIICNIAFVIYDIAISGVAATYMTRLHPHIAKIFKI